MDGGRRRKEDMHVHVQEGLSTNSPLCDDALTLVLLGGVEVLLPLSDSAIGTLHILLHTVHPLPLVHHQHIQITEHLIQLPHTPLNL